MRYGTVIACNYLAHARVLARSVTEHTGERLQVLLLDGEPGVLRADEPFDVIEPSELSIAPVELQRMAAMYTITELATAVKPWLLELLLAGPAATAACYLDPDVRLFAGLDDLDELLEHHDLVLTPHTSEPIEDDGLLPDEDSLLHAGVYNLGFIAVHARAKAFLDWWADHLRRDCVHDLPAARFVDQRWMDLAPAFFDAAVVRDPAWNVAYWNLHGRLVTRSGTRYLVDDRPLRFFHFSGFSPLTPHVLSKHVREAPRLDLADHPTIARLCAGYADALLDEGFVDSVDRPYRYDFTATGDPIDHRMRRVYRRAVMACEAEDRPIDVPNPFDAADPTAFTTWMFAPTTTVGDRPVSRYLRSVYDHRPDLQARFPDEPGASGPAFVSWCSRAGESAHIPREYLPPPSRAELASIGARPGAARRPGVNLMGYLDAENGVGEVARLLAATLDVAGVAHTTIASGATTSRRGESFVRGPEVHYDVTIACVNAFELASVRRQLGRGWPADGPTAGVWAWEVAQFPRWLAAAADLVDEIWTYSRHAADAIAAAVDRGVHVFAPPIPVRETVEADRAALNLPDGFLFVFCCDAHSVVARKNPMGVIDAFCRAFAPGEGPQLVVKCVNGDRYPVGLARLEARAGSRTDVHISTRYETPERQRALMIAADAYVSLHRAEGYGLTMAEAMSVGTPVIATGYSGNLEFMDDSNSLLVPAELVPIPLGCRPYPAGCPWAEPDLDVAAGAMRRLASDPPAACALGERARASVTEHHAPARRVPFVRTRVDALREGLR